MNRLILLFISLIAPAFAAGEQSESSCLLRPVDLSAIETRDFSHVDLAPSFNRGRQEEIESWWQASCPEFIRQNVRRSRQDNLICRIQGKSESKIVVGAHFDKVSVGKGVADNWSGVVLIDALMQDFKHAATQYTIDFVAFAEEEEGLYGSKEYVAQLDTPVVAMINLDTIGLTDLVIDGKSDDTLACQVQAIASEMSIKVTRKYWKDISSDWERFADEDIPAVGLHSVTRKTLRRIHHRRDKPGNVSLDHMDKAYRLATALIRQYVE